MHLPIRIVIADDHAIFREGFKVLLRTEQTFSMIGEAANGEELIDVVDTLKPDLVITDIKMPKMDGIRACKLIREKHAHVRVIAFSMHNDDNSIIEMLQAGATGYLLKNTNPDEIIGAIKTVHEGNPYYSSATSQRLGYMLGERKSNSYQQGVPITFTKRELDVIRLVCEQYMNKEIACELHVSIRTVETYRNSILAKIGAKNSIGIAMYAVKHNLLNNPDKSFKGSA